MGRFVTRCRTPPGLGIDAPSINDLVRKELPGELGRALRAGWPAGSEVCRLQRVPVRVQISSEDLAAGRLPADWASALSSALSEALKRPEDAGSLVRAASRADWRARAIGHFLDGSAGGRWEYAEFRHLLGLPTPLAVLALLVSVPEETSEVLWRLADRGRLERALGALDEEALDRAITAASPRAANQRPLTAADLLLVAKHLTSGEVAVEEDGLSSRSLALRLCGSLHARAAGGATVFPPSARRLYRALLAIDALLERSAALIVDRPASPSPPREVAALVERLVAVPSGGRGSVPDPGSTKLAGELGRLAQLLPTHPSPVPALPWIETRSAGLFLLCDLLERCGWIRLARQAFGNPPPGPPRLPFFLIGLGLSLTGRFEPSPQDLDPGLVLFAGCEGSPDLASLRRFLASEDREVRSRLLSSLLRRDSPAREETAGGEPARVMDTWEDTLDLLADELCRAFVERIRGFKTSSRAFVTEHFLATCGRLRVEERRITVHLAPNPLNAALRVSGTDLGIDGLGWLGGRDLRFVLDA